MRPVAIFRHAPIEGAGYFAIFLESHGIPWTLIPLDEGAPVPTSCDAFSGLCFMGGPMSVNDPIPWIEPVCTLIRQAVHEGVPVIGHCLGGQLMSKALGGRVTRNPVKEIGWTHVSRRSDADADAWLGPETPDPLVVFQWHGETFSLPPDAKLLLTNEACTHQAFTLGPHLGLQCHVEMTPEMIQDWCAHWHEEVRHLNQFPASIETPDAILAQIPEKMPALRQVADALYQRWIQGLKRD